MSRENTRIYSVHGSIPMGGDVLYTDDMEAKMKWNLAATGPDDAAISKDTTIVFGGDASLKLVTRTTNAATGDLAAAYRRIGMLHGRSVHLETAFYIPATGGPGLIAFKLLFYDGSTLHSPIIYYASSGTKWQYLNSSNVITDIPDGVIKMTENGWSWVRFSADFRTGYYGHLWVQGKEFDLSDLAFYTTANASGSHLRPEVEIKTATAAQDILYLDNLSVLAQSA